MKIIETGRRDLVEMRGGGGFLILFGLPFFIIGISVLAVTFGLIPAKDGPPLLFGIIFGSVFTIAGASMIFGRRGCIINCQKDSLTSWWGLLLPLHSREQSLRDFDRVMIIREIRRSDKSTYTVFPVRIAGAATQLNVHEYRAYEKARNLAEQVAKVLNFPLHDSCHGVEVIREADKLDESLKERIQRLQNLPVLPDPPAAMKSRILTKDRSVMIQIPAPGIQPAHLLVLILVLGITSIFVIAFLSSVSTLSASMLYVVMGFILLFALIAGLSVFAALVRPAMARTKVIVSPTSGLRVECDGFMTHKITEIPVDELEELLLPTESAALSEKVSPAVASAFRSMSREKMAVIARGDRQMALFGGHLPEEEKRYLHVLIQHVIMQE